MNLIRRLGRLLGVMAVVLFTGVLALPSTPVQANAHTANLRVSPATAPQNSDVTLTLAGFAANEVVSFWLTQPDGSVLQLGDVKVDSLGIAELPLFISAAFPTGGHSFSARGNRSGRLAIAKFELTLGRGVTSSAGIEINVDVIERAQGQCFIFNGTGYRANERVSTWIRFPANEVEDLGRVMTAGDGSFRYEICFGRLAPEGLYYFTAYGNTSNLTGIASFRLRRGDYIGAPTGAATLSMLPSSGRQLEVVTMVGTGFVPGERVSIWVTLPDGVVLSLFQGITLDGSFTEEIFLPPLPVGRHYFSAYGQTSGQRAVAAFDLLPGDGK